MRPLVPCCGHTCLVHVEDRLRLIRTLAAGGADAMHRHPWVAAYRFRVLALGGVCRHGGGPPGVIPLLEARA